MDLYRQLEVSQNRRMACEDRFLKRREKLERKAENLIGHLQRADGLTYYINLRPLSKGCIKESKNAYVLIDYLVRNRYV